MKIGDWLFKAGGTTMYGPTFGRGGLGVIFTVSILALLGSPSLTITVEHKNHDDTTFTTLGTFSLINAMGDFTKNLSGVKEEVRFAYSISATNDWEGVLLNMTAPAWRPYA